MDDGTDQRLREYLKRVTADLTRTRRRLHDVEARATEPIAVVGMACRYPGGANSPDALWRMVREERDAVTGFPTDRGWDVDAVFDPERSRPGTSYVREGGFIDNVTEFDPEFFGIPPREALVMDPQQRIMLELSWEAMESAGIVADSLRGTDTGVYIGAFDQGYGPHADQLSESLADHRDMGRSTGIVSGRISYVYGLEGPAMTVDTTSSSSLSALHLAVQALRSGDSSLVFTGGICVLPSPWVYVEYSRNGELSRSARSRSFAASADGIHFGEGAGLVLLERLSDARRHGHPVWAVIRGTACAQVGVRNGLTAPTTASERRLFRRALDNAGVPAGEVDLVEGHATGRRWGASMELEAVMSVYGKEHRPDSPLYLGSLKSHFGHSQAAAGIGGLLKTVMAMRNGVMPRTLNVDRPTPDVDWSAGTVRLLTEPRPWPATGRPRRAAVSSFGLSGTIDHVVLEHDPDTDGEPGPTPDPTGPAPWLLSAATPGALRDQARRLVGRLTERPDLTEADVAFSLATTRAALAERAAVLGDPDTRHAALTALADGAEHPALWTDTARDGRLTVVFPDPRTAPPPSGAFRSRPAFAEAVERVRAAFSAAGAVRVDGTDPVSRAAGGLAVQIGLYAVLSECAVLPDRLSGHGFGELAALHCAGALSLPGAVRTVLTLARQAADPAAAAETLLPEGVGRPRIPVLSAVEPTPVDLAVLRDPRHWDRLRDTVFRPEPVGPPDVGPDDTVMVLAATVAPGSPGAVIALGADEDGSARALARAHLRGVGVDWARFLPAGRRVDLPRYPFQRRRYWLAPGVGGRDTATAGLVPVDHPLLGAATRIAGTDEWLLTGSVSTAVDRWLNDTTVDGEPTLIPGALLDLAWRAGALVGAPRVAELRPDRPVPLGPRTRVQLRVGPLDADGRRSVTVHTTGPDGTDWTRCAVGVLAAGTPPPADSPPWDPGRGAPITVPVTPPSRRPGLRHGPMARAVVEARQDGAELFARLAVPAEPAQQAERFGLHPVLLEAVRSLAAARRLDLPEVFADAELWTTGTSTAELRWHTGTGRVLFTDASGAPIARLTIATTR